LRALLCAALACAGCWDFDALGRRYHPDLAESPGAHDLAGVGASDLAGADLAGVRGPDLATAMPDLMPSAAWKQEPINSTSVGLYAVWGSSATDVYVVGDSGAIYHSAGDGNWTFHSTGSSYTLYGVWGSSANDVYTVSSGGEIYHSVNGGPWGLVATGIPSVPALYGIWGSGPNDVWAVGTAGYVHYNGAWSKTDVGADTLKAAWGNGTSVWIGGDNGGLYRVTGTSAPVAESATPDDINGIWGTGGDIFLVTQGGAILHSVGDGTWTTSYTQSFELDGIWGSSLNNVQVVGFGTHLVGTGGVFADDPIVSPTGFQWAVWGSSANDMYIVGDRGTILHFKM
jgi:hypothetical protein